MPRRLALLAVCAALAACGGSDDSATVEDETPAIPADADHEAVRVIDAWAKALAAGDIEAAAAYFAVPSIAENGIVVRIQSEQDAMSFNASLPCGGELIRAETEGELTTATFRLTERPGPGICGEGTGETAQTAFVIEDELIVEWRRVALPGQEGPRRTT